MGKGIRGGIVVGVAVLVAAVVYSALYFQNGLFHYENGGVSIVLVLVWALVVAVLLVVLWQRMLVREEYLRNFYVSDETLFNFELGAVPLSDVAPDKDSAKLVEHLHTSLPKLTYGNEPLDPPADFKPTLCVLSRRYANGSKGEDWCGSVQRIQQRDDGHRTFVEVATFENASDLVKALNTAWK